MKILQSILVAVICMSLSASAVSAQAPLSENERTRWLSEIREYKHEFLAKDLELTREQQREFFPLYENASMRKPAPLKPRSVMIRMQVTLK